MSWFNGFLISFIFAGVVLTLVLSEKIYKKLKKLEKDISEIRDAVIKED
jgi:hypothetical protein